MTRLKIPVSGALLAVFCACLAGCGPRTAAGPSGFRPVDGDAAVFWDRQFTDNAELMNSLVGEFNNQWPGLPIRLEHSGAYADIFRKVSASIQARVLPAMAVSYESMTTEYIATGAVADVESVAALSGLEWTEEERADFYPALLESNRYPGHGDRLYSFPFAKSVLMMYYNRRVMADAGIDAPPPTWDEFLAQCRRVKARTGKYAHAISADCSTVDGMIYSMGGEVLAGTETLFDAPAAVAVFELYETLVREGLAYAITPGTYDDNLALSKDEVAFVLRTSSGRGDMMRAMDNDKGRWGLTRIPQKDPARPATVLFGPGVTLFDTTEEQKKAAWAFVRWFTSPRISARWAAGTGYLPVRRSSLEQPEIKRLFAEWEHNRAPFDCLEFARSEPNVPGWQQVRDLVVRALGDVIAGTATAREATEKLKRDADAVLARAARWQ